MKEQKEQRTVSKKQFIVLSWGEEYFILDYKIQLSRPDCWTHVSQAEHREMIWQWSHNIFDTFLYLFTTMMLKKHNFFDRVKYIKNKHLDQYQGVYDKNMISNFLSKFQW